MEEKKNPFYLFTANQLKQVTEKYHQYCKFLVRRYFRIIDFIYYHLFYLNAPHQSKMDGLPPSSEIPLHYLYAHRGTQKAIGLFKSTSVFCSWVIINKQKLMPNRIKVWWPAIFLWLLRPGHVMERHHAHPRRLKGTANIFTCSLLVADSGTIRQSLERNT